MLLYICTKFHENIFCDIKVTKQRRFSLEKFQKVTKQRRFSLEKFQRGIILQKLKVELQFLFSAHCLILVYFSSQFHENFYDSF